MGNYCVRQPFTDYTAADYARVVGGSLTGFFWLTQRAIAEMATRYGGHVVSILATLGEVADPGTPAVLAALTNGGLTAATRSLAIEHAAYGIRVNAISPGRAGQVSDVVSGVLLLESSPGITGKILRIDGTPNEQATSRETTG
jgi:NAD(P)-dependent dehydrogenase (short-subunit alcohol dehydrogenase family)